MKSAIISALLFISTANAAGASKTAVKTVAPTKAPTPVPKPPTPVPKPPTPVPKPPTPVPKPPTPTRAPATLVPPRTPVPRPSRTPPPLPAHTPTAVPQQPPPPPQPASFHAVFLVNDATVNTTEFRADYAEWIGFDPSHVSVRIEPPAVNSTNTVVHAYLVNAVNSSGGYPTPKALADWVMAEASEFFGANGSYPLAGPPSNTTIWFEWAPPAAYQCTSCIHQYSRETPPICQPWIRAHAHVPLFAAPSSSAFAIVINALNAQAAERANQTAGNGTEQNATNPYPGFTGDMTGCNAMLVTLACSKAYPFCNNGAALPVCRSQCDAVRAACPAEVVQQLVNASASLLDCGNSAQFKQDLFAPAAPCYSAFHPAFLGQPAAPCATKAEEPPAVPVPPVHANVTGTSSQPVRVYAQIEVPMLLASGADPKLDDDDLEQMTSDIHDMFGLNASTVTGVSVARPVTIKGNNTVVNVYFANVVRTATPLAYWNATGVWKVLTAGIKTAVFKERWGDAVLWMSPREDKFECTGCPAADLTTVHAVCKPFATALYSGNVKPFNTATPSAVSSALVALAAPKAQEAIGPVCGDFLKLLACGLFYGPCYKGAQLLPCASTCHHISKFCASEALGLISNSEEAKAVLNLLNCTSATYVQNATATPCLEVYDDEWILKAPTACAPPPVAKYPVPPPFAEVTLTLVPEVAAPATIHLCGGCGSDDESHDHEEENTTAEETHDHAFTCPADKAKTVTLSDTSCIQLQATANICHQLTTCGTVAPAAGQAAAYYKYTGSSKKGSLQFYSDAACANKTSSVLETRENECKSRLQMIPGGISVATMKLSFAAVLTSVQQNAVENEFRLKFQNSHPMLTHVLVEFIWTPAARRAGSTSLTVKVGAPNNVASASGGNKVGGALANEIAAQLSEAVTSDETFKSSLQSVSGTTFSDPEVSKAPEDSDGSSIIGWIILIVLVVIAIVVAVALLLYFLVFSGKKSKAPKVKSAGTYDEENSYAGHSA